MYLWISEEAKEELDLMLQTYETEIEEGKASLEKKTRRLSKAFLQT